MDFWYKWGLASEPLWVQILLGLNILLLLLAGWFLVINLRFRRNFRRWMKSDAGSLGRQVEDCFEQVANVLAQGKKLEEQNSRIEAWRPTAIQHVGLLRFNAFPDMGGELSFSLAFLDGKGNGVVVSSLYGREESRFFAKSVEGWASAYRLSGEEKEAIKKAGEGADRG